MNRLNVCWKGLLTRSFGFHLAFFFILSAVKVSSVNVSEMCMKNQCHLAVAQNTNFQAECCATVSGFYELHQILSY